MTQSPDHSLLLAGEEGFPIYFDGSLDASVHLQKSCKINRGEKKSFYCVLILAFEKGFRKKAD